MYRQGHEAQIEAVETLEEHRGRGLATAFVLAAARAAQEAGATWIFLWADAEDWPRQWYRRLGFVEGSHAADFTRPSPEDAAAMAAAKSPGSP
jgi:GNAT superfamily N-acetyltransferase